MKDTDIRAFIKSIDPKKFSLIKKTIEVFKCIDVNIVPLKKKEPVPTQKDWKIYDKALVNKFTKLDHEGKLPMPPFMLNNATHVTGNKFYEHLRHEISNGPDGARAQTGALQSDLEQLFEIVD